MKKSAILFVLALALGAISAQAQKFEPKWAGTVTALQISGDTVAVETEKANVKVKTDNSTCKIIFGIGSTTQKAVIEGGQSSTQLSPDEPVVLIVKCKDNDSDPTSFIQIIKFDEKKKERQAELAFVNVVDNVSEGNMKIIPYEADSYGKSSYIIKMKPQEGEFGVRILNPNEKDEKVTIFHCFGIHSAKK